MWADWVITLRAAERLHSPPWTVDADASYPAPPVVWKHRAAALIRAEAKATAIVRERDEKENTRQRRDRERRERMNRAMGRH